MLNQKSYLATQLVLLVFIFISIAYLRVESLICFLYYALFWFAHALFLLPKLLREFSFAFLVNSSLVSAYYLLQTTVSPETYGTTSGLGSRTDDSYFFSLIADEIPNLMDTRSNYEEYENFFTSIIKWVTPFKIYYPIDIIFCNSQVP